MAGNGTPDHNGGVERAAEAVVIAVFTILRIIGALFHVIWLVILALYRTLDQVQMAENPTIGDAITALPPVPTTSIDRCCRVRLHSSSGCRHVRISDQPTVIPTVIDTPAPSPVSAPAQSPVHEDPQNATPAPAYLPADTPNGVPMNVHIAANQIYDVDDESGQPWFAVIRGRRVGVMQSWARAGVFVIRVPNNLSQRFDTRAQALAAYHRALRAGEVRVIGN